MANLLAENKLTFCEGNGSWASKEVSPVTYADVKVGRVLSTKVGKNCLGSLNHWEQH